ncbi:MAG: hypothetical protein EAZ07_07810 [Cytophagales bacterium]|nr:MAG: hypothetical protein EAZ07_07810 [Cytophagales bacterium]
MKNIFKLIIFILGIGLASIANAQISNSTHTHETVPPDPAEEIQLEKKYSKKHIRQAKKEKERHAKHNLKMEKKRLKSSGDAHFGAIGYDGVSKYSGKAHKRHLKSNKD